MSAVHDEFLAATACIVARLPRHPQDLAEFAGPNIRESSSHWRQDPKLMSQRASYLCATACGQHRVGMRQGGRERLLEKDVAPVFGRSRDHGYSIADPARADRDEMELLLGQHFTVIRV